MKKIILVALLAIVGAVFAQEKTEQSLAERLNLVQKKSDKFNVFLHFQSSFDAVKEENVDLKTAFKARELRLEFSGKLNDKISYRLRQKLNKKTNGESQDNLSKATDFMYVTYQATDKLNLTIGKQCQVWGGMEFDLNPINVYEYSDFISGMDCFMVGVNLNFKLADNHDLNLQVTDSRNSKFSDTFDVDKIQNGGTIKESNSPLAYIANWNGKLFDGKLQTRWAYGIETQAKEKYSKMLTIGNKLNLDKFQIAFDYMRADQDIDRLGFASQGNIQQDVTYNSFITRLEFQPAEQWNLFAKYMYETAQVNGIDDTRVSQGYFVGVEHLPFKSEDLRFFLTYVGRNIDDYGVKSNKNQVSVGIMYRIKAF